MPDPAHIDPYDPTAVSRAAVVTMAMIDTDTDRLQTDDHDARLRALSYLTPRYAAQVRAEQIQPAPAQVWRQWARHHAYLRVRVVPAATETPPDTGTLARRAWTLVTIPTGRDHWAGSPVTNITEFVTLTRGDPGHPWRVGLVTTGLYGAQAVTP